MKKLLLLLLLVLIPSVTFADAYRYDRSRMNKRIDNYFNPLMFNPVLWLDASDSSSITVETGVSNWSDKSYNGNDVVQSDTSKQPVLSGSSVIFDGIDDYLFVADNVTLSPSTELTFFVVFTDSDLTDEGNFLSKAYNASYRGRIDNTGNARLIIKTDGGLLTPASSNTPVSQDTRYIISYRYEAGVSITAELDGVNIIDVANTDTVGIDDSTDSLFVGSARATSEFFHGIINEVIIYNNALSDSERANVTRHLKNKWL